MSRFFVIFSTPRYGLSASGTMTLPVTMEMTLVGRFYERLADHALNVARRVIYLAGPAAH